MIAIRFPASAGLPERIFAKLAKIPTQTAEVQVLPFAPAYWPLGRQSKQERVLPLPPILETSTPCEPKLEFKIHEKPKFDIVPLTMPRSEEFQIPGREIMRANRVVELQRRQVELLNQRQPPGCHLMAWSMLPENIWQGANATFMMMACDFFPASAQNTLLLPVTRKGADQLQLPLHPFKATGSLTDEAQSGVAKLRAAFVLEHEQVLAAMQRGDISSLVNRPARKKKFADDLKNLAQKLAITQFGKKAFDHHQITFGAALNYETPPSL